METIISICLGVGLAASVGFRVFLPLFALSLAAYFNVLELNGSWEWLGSSAAIITFGVATLVEIFAYYIPFVDNILDTVSVPLAAFGGTIVMMSTMIDLSPVANWSIAIIAGGGTAAAISGASSITRLASTTSTAGIANPIVTSLETMISMVMSFVSLFLPLLAISLVIIVLVVIYKFRKKFKTPKS